MKRRRFSFCPGSNNAEHQRAWQVLMSVPKGQRNSFIAKAVLEKTEKVELEATVRKVMQEEFRTVTLQAPPQTENKTKQEIPQEMFDFLDEFVNQ